MSISKNNEAFVGAFNTANEFNATAGAAISGFRFVNVTGDGPAVEQAGAGDSPAGITAQAAADGQTVRVVTGGVGIVDVDGSIDTTSATSKYIKSGANGIGVPCSAEDAYYAIALETNATGAGTIRVVIRAGEVPA